MKKIALKILLDGRLGYRFRRLNYIVFRSSKDTDENLHKYLWGDNK